MDRGKIFTAEETEAALYFHNPWWREKNVPSELVESFFRRQFYVISEYLKTLRRIIILKGPRRTGKSTIIYQVIGSLLKSGTDPYDILYLPLMMLR